MSQPPRLRLLVPVLAFSGITVSSMQTLIIPLVPQLPSLLDASAADASWAVTATLLAAAVATPVMGRLADMYGKKRLLLLSLVLLLVGSVLCALSSGLAVLVVGRGLQGASAAVIPLGISIMRDALDADRLASATALMSASLGVGGALGLPLASFIADRADWHVLFWTAAALALVALALVALVAPRGAHSGGRFDVVGAIGLAIALVCVLLPVSKGGEWGWGSPVVIGLFLVAAVVLLLWGRWELRTTQPLVDLRISRGRQVLLTNTASAVFGFAMFAQSLVLPQVLQLPPETGYGLGQSVMIAGLVMAPAGLVMIPMAPISARISRAAGPRTTLMLGAVVVAVGYAIGAVWLDQIWQVVVVSAVIGSGIGLAYGAMPSLIMAAVPVSETAAANSLNNLMRALGTSVASAVAGVLVASVTIDVGGVSMPGRSAFTILMVAAATAAIGAIVIAAFIPRRRPGATAAASTQVVGSARGVRV